MVDRRQGFEAWLERGIRQYAASGPRAGDPAEVAARAMTARLHGSATPLVGVVSAVAATGLAIILAAVVLAGPRPEPGAASLGDGEAAASSCEARAWPLVPVSCSRAEDEVSTGARVDETRIWLTTLEAVKSALDPPQQVREPPAETPMWLFVYDGLWTCCIHEDEEGRLVGPTDQTRWIIVVDALTGKFVYIHDWTGKDVPTRFKAIES